MNVHGGMKYFEELRYKPDPKEKQSSESRPKY